MPLSAPVDLNTQPMSEEDLERFSRLAMLTSGLNAPAAPAPQYVQPMPAGQSSAGMARLVSQLQPRLGEVSPATAMESRRSVLLPRNSPTNSGFTLTKNVYRMKPGAQASSSTGQESYPGESADTTPEPVAAGRNPAAVARMASGAPRYVGQGATQMNPEPPSPLAIAGSAAQRGAQGEPGVPPPPPKPVYGPSGRSFNTTGVQALEHGAENVRDIAAEAPQINDPRFKHHGLRRAFDIIGGIAQGALALNPMVGVQAYRNLAHSTYDNAAKDWNTRLGAAEEANKGNEALASKEIEQQTGEARLAHEQTMEQILQNNVQFKEQQLALTKAMDEAKMAQMQNNADLAQQRLADAESRTQQMFQVAMLNARSNDDRRSAENARDQALLAIKSQQLQNAQTDEQRKQIADQLRGLMGEYSKNKQYQQAHPFLSWVGGNSTDVGAQEQQINDLLKRYGTGALPPAGGGAGAGPQTATAAQLHQYAVEHKITDDRARQAFEQAGIKVGK